MPYLDEVKTCENLAEEFFKELDKLIDSPLCIDDFSLAGLVELVDKYKPLMLK